MEHGLAALPVPGQIDRQLVDGGRCPIEPASAQLLQFDDTLAGGTEFAGHATVAGGRAAWEGAVAVRADGGHTRVFAPLAAEAAVVRDLDVEVELGASDDRVKRARKGVAPG